MSDIKKHKRVNDILLGPLERPALQWLAAKTPAWASPDTMTIIGIIGTLMIFAGYWLSQIHIGFVWMASLGFVVNWYGDSLDGTLARYRNIPRPKYGFFIDHIVDAFSQLFIFTGLGLSPFVRFEFAIMTLVCYLLLSVFVYVRMNVMGEFKISYGKLGPTEIRVIAIIFNTITFFGGNPAFDFGFVTLTIYEIFCLVVSIILFSMFLISSIKDGAYLAKIDPVKKPEE